MTAIRVDNTILRTIARCSTESLLRHGFGYTSREESAALQSGTAAHEALACWLRGGGGWQAQPGHTLLGDALAAFDAGYRDYSAEHVEPHVALQPWLARLTWQNTRAILERWFETHPLHMLPFRVERKLIEVGFQIPLDDEGEFVFCGRFDAIVSDDSGALYVLDHKTTGSLTPYWAKKFRLDSQMSGYVWAAEQTLEQRVTGVYINAIEFSKLPSSDRKCSRAWGNGKQPHGVPYSECGPEHANFEILTYSRSPEKLAAWRADAIDLARKYKFLLEQYPVLDDIARTPQEGTFHNACGFCEFSDFCDASRPASNVETLFVHRPWTPWERV